MKPKLKLRGYFKVEKLHHEFRARTAIRDSKLKLVLISKKYEQELGAIDVEESEE